MAAVSRLTSTERYSAGALLALAIRHAQINQTHPLGADELDQKARGLSSNATPNSTPSSPGDGDGVGEELWIHESNGLLRPVFRFLDIDPKAWAGLEETAASSAINHHIGAHQRMLLEENNEISSDKSEDKLALSKTIDIMAMNLETADPSVQQRTDNYSKYAEDDSGKSHSEMANETTDAKPEQSASLQSRNTKTSLSTQDVFNQFEYGETSSMENNPSVYQQKVVVLYELLSACVADIPQEGKQGPRHRKGYDARHRVAMRLLATWFDIKWIKVEAMEIMIACSAMAVANEEEQTQQSDSEKSTWSEWKRNGLIGAAALTGGALMAITGGLAAPAIAAGFGAVAPTLGTLVPFIGASGFAAMATAAGSVAGSVAVAASFGAAGAGLTGAKMARRIGDIEEFEFKPLGDNHNQGRLAVGILVSGFVFEEEDFKRPWEGVEDNLERYALQWESKNLIAVSTSIEDWLTSRLTSELMRQGAMLTVLGGLVSALSFPTTLFTVTSFIDSAWAVAIDRSDKAGKLLAEVLSNGLQGNRPVTLIGYSLGARIIFKCLEELAAAGADGEGLIERVVLFGTPVSVQEEDWVIARKIVAGRFINAYSSNDWILGITFRASLLTQGLAGIQAINVPGIENVDVSNFINGHSSYLLAVQNLLKQLELDSCYPVFQHSPIKEERENIANANKEEMENIAHANKEELDNIAHAKQL